MAADQRFSSTVRLDLYLKPVLLTLVRSGKSIRRFAPAGFFQEFGEFDADSERELDCVPAHPSLIARATARLRCILIKTKIPVATASTTTTAITITTREIITSSSLARRRDIQ